MIGSCIAFNPCFKCDEKEKCNICELTYRRNGYIKSPTADVVEVVHAEWVGIEYDGYADGYPVYDKWECSHCHEEFSSEGEPPLYNYCPECGAKMDGERSENGK